VPKLVAILRFIRRSTLLITVGLVGGVVLGAGVVMLVTPGPGLLVIIAGLAILATQFAWAERTLDKVKQRAVLARDKASARRARRRAPARPHSSSAGAAASLAADPLPSAHHPSGDYSVDGTPVESLPVESRSAGDPSSGPVAADTESQATG